jgi:hypothetical protein
MARHSLPARAFSAQACKHRTKKGRNENRCAPEGSRADRQARATAAIKNLAQRFFTIRRLRIWKWMVPFWSSHAGSISSGDVSFDGSNPFAV